MYVGGAGRDMQASVQICVIRACRGQGRPWMPFSLTFYLGSLMEFGTESRGVANPSNPLVSALSGLVTGMSGHALLFIMVLRI